MKYVIFNNTIVQVCVNKELTLKALLKELLKRDVFPISIIYCRRVFLFFFSARSIALARNENFSIVELFQLEKPLVHVSFPSNGMQLN